MMPVPKDSDFQRLPIEPEDGFPQAFVLSFDGKLYQLTFSVSFLRLEPFKMGKAGGSLSPQSVTQRAQMVPLGTPGVRASLPGQRQDEPERTIYVLPQEELYVVMKVERDDL